VLRRDAERTAAQGISVLSPKSDIVVNGRVQDAYPAVGRRITSVAQSILQMQSELQFKTSIAPDVIIVAQLFGLFSNVAMPNLRFCIGALLSLGLSASLSSVVPRLCLTGVKRRRAKSLIRLSLLHFAILAKRSRRAERHGFATKGLNHTEDNASKFSHLRDRTSDGRVRGRGAGAGLRVAIAAFQCELS
jgi:hypothetical protein